MNTNTKKTKSTDIVFSNRMSRHFDELKWLYMEVYQGCDKFFEELCNEMERYYKARSSKLKRLDLQREAEPDWYKNQNIVGTMLYTENFGGNLTGVREHLDYLKESQINYIHLMPLLDTTEGKSDGGYAVKNYRSVDPRLGTMEDLEALTDECHKNGMCVCLDYVMNHTSEDHEWAVRARAGEKYYQDMYFFFDDYSTPYEYEKTVPQVFPKTAPGNFTYLSEISKFVMTTFYPYQWDLNYWNPRVFNEMVYNLLFLANRGIDVLRIDAVPYIWKELGTNCRNLPRVHTIVRMIRMIVEIVAPGTLLLGEVVMEPKELAPYFGTVEKPECHMLYNATTMCTIWHTVATKDIRLLRFQTDQVVRLPKEYCFINYIRCHDDIGWGLDYNYIKQFGMSEVAHKKYLNDFFLGNTFDSVSTGELYNSDPETGDARFCATTASMCGIERGGFENNEEKISRGIQLDLMLHSFIMFQTGIPVIYSGDEVGFVNDWEYKKNPAKVEDSRYLHRGKFPWKNIDKLEDNASVEYRIYNGLKKVEAVRANNSAFDAKANCYTIETHNNEVMGMIRITETAKVVGLFNFSNAKATAYVCELTEPFFNLIKEKGCEGSYCIDLEPYEYVWAKVGDCGE